MRSVGVKTLFFLLIFTNFLWAQSPYEVTKRGYKPAKQLVHDFGKIFTPIERAQLEQTLVNYDNETSVQIVVVTFEKLDGYPIETLGNEIGENWGVGQKDEHNGIVIVIGKDDRKVTLRGAYGIQAKMPPTIEKLIIDKEIIPAFKNGDYYQGVQNAFQAIKLQLEGKYVNKKSNLDNVDAEDLGSILLIIFIVILFIVITSKNSGNRNNRGGGGGSIWRDIIITNTGTRPWTGGGFGGGSWGGGSSGGGFGGFGGGSFGGGGASGSW